MPDSPIATPTIPQPMIGQQPGIVYRMPEFTSPLATPEYIAAAVINQGQAPREFSASVTTEAQPAGILMPMTGSIQGVLLVIVFILSCLLVMREEE